MIPQSFMENIFSTPAYLSSWPQDALCVRLTTWLMTDLFFWMWTTLLPTWHFFIMSPQRENRFIWARIQTVDKSILCAGLKQPQLWVNSWACETNSRRQINKVHCTINIKQYAAAAFAMIIYDCKVLKGTWLNVVWLWILCASSNSTNEK